MLLYFMQQGNQNPFFAFMLFDGFVDLVPINFRWFHIVSPIVLLLVKLLFEPFICVLQIPIRFKVQGSRFTVESLTPVFKRYALCAKPHALCLF